MKRRISLVLASILVMSTLTACGNNVSKKNDENQSNKKTVEVRVEALKGPTSMGMVKMMNDSKKAEGNVKYDYKIAGAVDEVIPDIVGGKVDIAAVPSNLSSVLYNKTKGKVVTLAINTLGILYIVENGSNNIHKVSDLKGKTIYSSGKGATPEIALNYILEKNGLKPQKDVKIEYKSEHTECLQALLKNKDSIALLPQPFVTVAKTKAPKLKIALDLNKEWNDVNKDSKDKSNMITGVLVARKDFVEKNGPIVSEFLKNYKSSIEFTNKDVDKAAKFIGEYKIVPTPIAKKAIPHCNITFIDGNEMKDKLSAYLNVLYNANPKSIGGKMPGEDFYYISQN